LVLNVRREFTTPDAFIRNILTKDHISLIKMGKNLTKPLLESYEILDIEDLAEDEEGLAFLDDFIYPNQYIRR